MSRPSVERETARAAYVAATPSSSAMGTWAASTFDALSIPIYRTLWFGTIASWFAFSMSQTAQGVVAFDLTRSNSAVGLVLFAQGIAMAILNPIGGAIADRFVKRTLIIAAQLVIFCVMLSTAILLATDLISVLFLSLGAFIMGCMFSFLGPTRTALFGELIPEEKLGNAMALLQAGNQFVRIGGLFLGAALMSWALVGPKGVYFMNAAIFVYVIITFFRIPASPPIPKRETGIIEDIRIGIGYIIHDKRLLHCVVSFHTLTIFGLAYMVLLPGYSKEVLNAGTAGIGLLLGISAIGGLVMSLIVASLASSRKAQTYLFMAGLCTGVSLILAGIAPSFAVAMIIFFFLGGGQAAFQTLNNAVTMNLTDPDYYGRVIGIVFLAWGLSNVIGLPVGFLADEIGERAVMAGTGAILCVLICFLIFWLRRIEASEDVRAYPTY